MVKTAALKIMLPVILVSVLAGCVSARSPQARATSRVGPIAAALRAYHHETGDYPHQLEELRPRYLRADVSFFDDTTNHIWYCFYDRVDRNNYSIQFYTPPCSEAIYKNGSFTEAYGPAFK
jgi:hypothetical protein